MNIADLIVFTDRVFVKFSDLFIGELANRLYSITPHQHSSFQAKSPEEEVDVLHVMG